MAYQSITTQLLDIAGKEQELKNMQIEGGLRQAQTQQLLKTMKAQDDADKTAQEYNAVRRRLDAQQRGEVGPGGGAAPQGEMQQVLQPLMESRQSTLNAIKAARQASLSSGDAHTQQIYDKQAEAEETHLRQIDLDMAAARKEFAGRASSVAGAADKDNMEKTNADMEAMMGPKWADKAPVDRDLLGRPMWGPKTAAFFKNLQKQGQSAEQQAKNEEAALRLKEQQSRDAESAREHRVREREAEARLAEAREGLNIRRDEATRRAEVQKAKQDRLDKLDKAGKDPSSSSVKNLAPSLAKQYNLSADDAPRMAMAVLQRKAELVREDPELNNLDAENQAVKEISNAMVHPDEGHPPGVMEKVKTWWTGEPTKPGKATYGDKNAVKGAVKPITTGFAQPKTADEFFASMRGE